MTPWQTYSERYPMLISALTNAKRSDRMAHVDGNAGPAVIERDTADKDSHGTLLSARARPWTGRRHCMGSNPIGDAFAED